MAIVINSAWDAELFKKEREEARKHINSAWDAQMFYQTYGGNGQSGDWGSSSYRERMSIKGSAYYVYDAAQRKWKALSASTFDSGAFSSALSGKLSLTPDSTGVLSQIGVVDSATDAKTNSKKKAEKDYIEVEFNTLVGELQLIPTKNNMKIKPNTTIYLDGVGKYLNGRYFVTEVRKSLSSEGYSLSINVLKNGFADQKDMNSNTSNPYSQRPMEVSVTSNTVSSHLIVGSKVKIVGEAVYSNDKEGTPIPETIKQKDLVIEEITNDGLRAKLAPINSWTYVKFLSPI